MQDTYWEIRPEFRDLRSALIVSGFCRIMQFHLVEQPTTKTIETLLVQEPDLPVSATPHYVVIRITGVEDYAGTVVPRSRRILVDLNLSLTYTQERFNGIIDIMRPKLLSIVTPNAPDHNC